MLYFYQSQIPSSPKKFRLFVGQIFIWKELFCPLENYNNINNGLITIILLNIIFIIINFILIDIKQFKEILILY